MSAIALSPRRRRRVTSALLTALTYLILIIMLAPIAWLIIGATQTSGAISNGTYHVLHPTLHAFSAMWKSVDFGHYFANSLIICSLAALFATVLASGAGYALARYTSTPLKAYGVSVLRPVSIRLAASSPSPPRTSDGRDPRDPTSWPDSGAATTVIAAIGTVSRPACSGDRPRVVCR